MTAITPDQLLTAYCNGAFPMGESRDADEVRWYIPRIRGVIPLDAVHVPRRLRATIRADRFTVRIDTAFRAVMEGCASPEAGRADTWINGPILDLYTALFEAGRAHSVECWHEDRLVGGVYGVRIGAAFFAESMFSLTRDASKVALVHLIARLTAGGFSLLDTQFTTDHLRQFGAVDLDQESYRTALDRAVTGHADFYRLEAACSGSSALQFITQTS